MLSKQLKQYMTQVLQYGTPTYNDEKLLNLINFATTSGSETLLNVLEKYQAALQKNNKQLALKHFATLNMYI